MKKFFPIFLALLALAACTSEYDKMLNEARRAGRPGDDDVFYATIEDAGAADPQTKVFADEQMRVLWNADDRISIFLNYTYNQPYRFDGNDGDNAGGFTKVPTDDELITGNPLDHIYAVYPYNAATSISNKGILSVELPAEQHYLAHSFGKGANTMVSVTDGNMLLFKNAGGYLSFKFYGDGARVKSITLKGNNHEKLAGKAAITMAVGGLPAVKMQNDATEEITLTCADPVALGVDSEHYKEFWFVIPPTTFEQGFTVTVTDANGGVFAKTTSKSITVSRNKLNRMAPIEVVQASSSHESVDLGLSVRWATCNVGADSPEEYGDYFAWGETEPKTDYSLTTYRWYDMSTSKFTKYVVNEKYGVVDGKTVLDESDDAARVKWGGNWRMPTDSEFDELITNCDREWTTENGVWGLRFTSKKVGFTDRSIFLPAAGWKQMTDDYTVDGETGRYLSSSLVTSKTYDAYIFFYYTIANPLVAEGDRDYGFSVRPVMDGERVPVESISLSQTTLTLKQGESKLLSYTILPANATYPSVTWDSSVPAIATVNDGRVTAVFPGKTTVTVTTMEGKSASCEVTVVGTSGVPESVDLGLSVDWATFNIGATAPDEYGDFFAWGETMPKDGSYDWTTYKWYDASSKKFTKYSGVRESLEIQDDAARVSWGEGWRMPTKEEIEELKTNCTWTWTQENNVPGYRVCGKDGYSENYIFIPAAGYLDEEKHEQAGELGAFWCSKSYANNAAYYLIFESDYVNVYYDLKRYGLSIRPVRVIASGISINKTSMTLKVGNIGKLKETVLPIDATDKNVSWESSAPEVATVTSDGLVKAIAPGQAVIKVTTQRKGFSATCVVTVKDYTPSTYVDLGLSVKWATCNVGADSPEEIGDYFAWGEVSSKNDYSWSSYDWCDGSETTLNKYNDDPEYGLVDRKTRLELSDDAAHANWGGKWRMPTEDELQQLISQCNWSSTKQGGKEGFKITSKINGNSIFLPACGIRDGTDIGGNSYCILWSSNLYSKPSRARVAFYNPDEGSDLSSALRHWGLPVRPVYDEGVESVPVTGVTLQPKSMSLCVGCGGTLVWTVTPETATNNEVTWHSSNPAVARISSGGRVFAKSPGIATITVTTVDGGFTATCQVSVDSPMVFDYVDLGLSVNWATINVGATSPSDFGEYFAWGETNPKDTYGWDNYLWGNGASFNKYNTSGVLLEPDDDAAAVYWGQGWRTPSAAEMEELVRDCSWNWTREGLVYGYRITSKKTGYTDKSIFLPAAGYYENGELVHVMNRGNYWSSSLISSQIDQSSLLYLSSSVRSVSTDNRSLGCPIRPVIDKISIYTKHTKGIKPVTLCVLPDGYRESEKSLFLERAKQGMDFMFNVEPYKSLKDYFTVYFLWEPSEDSGATITDGHDNIITKRNTAFGSRWGDGYHDMKADYEKVFDFVSTHCPEVYNGKVTIEDARILLLINDTRMGGVCKSSPDGTAYCMVSALPEGTWSFPTSMAASNNPEDGLAKRTLTLQEVNELYGLVHGDWKNVFLHEFGGHCIARLTDEYWQSEQDSVAVMGDIAEHSEQIPYALNISGWYDDARVPWRELLDLKAQLEASNPLYSRIGIFQGGKNAKFNRWRSEEVSCMIDNRPYFSMWQRYLITKRIKELAGQSFILSEFLSTDYPFDPIRDSGNKYIPASYEAIKILPMGPSPDFHYNDLMK